jgi:hypothetical protein
MERISGEKKVSGFSYANFIPLVPDSHFLLQKRFMNEILINNEFIWPILI